ncbi:MAG: DUF1501 domain-containing protein, partial [Verrucomicrobiae bacterium]|nr:DUF1501 domain-containing protein [Verrucomicrobiae bacterium]
MNKQKSKNAGSTGMFGMPISRREAIRRGAFATAGLMVLGERSLNATLTQGAKTPQVKAKAKSVIQVFLWGGMSHSDTWDPKPDAGYDYTGSLPGIVKSNVDGIVLGELFPELAKQADKFSIIRSMTHRNNGHETAAYLMQTGHTPGERLAYPCIGAVFAMMKVQAGYKGLIPPYVVLTQPQGRFSESGFLGNRYKPFATGGDPNAQRFEVEGVVARGITDERQKARSEFLQRIDSLASAMPNSPQVVASKKAEKEAYE